MPGPPLRGTLSPPATSITKICTSTRARLNVAVRLSPPLSRSTTSGANFASSVVERVEVLADVVADRGVRAAAGLHADDALGRQHPRALEDRGVLRGEDVVGDDRDRQLVAQRPAQGRDQLGLAAADRPADADPQRAAEPRTGAVVVVGARRAWSWSCACECALPITVSSGREHPDVPLPRAPWPRSRRAARCARAGRPAGASA